jgi:hypothetical protein
MSEDASKWNILLTIKLCAPHYQWKSNWYEIKILIYFDLKKNYNLKIKFHDIKKKFYEIIFTSINFITWNSIFNYSKLFFNALIIPRNSWNANNLQRLFKKIMNFLFQCNVTLFELKYLLLLWHGRTKIFNGKVIIWKSKYGKVLVWNCCTKPLN